MKKLLFIFTALFAVVSMNAQEENNALVSLLKVNFEGVTPKYLPTGDEPMAVESTAEGLALTHSHAYGSSLNCRIQITDDCLTLQKKHHYLIRLTIRIPYEKRDNGTLSVYLGNERLSSLSWLILQGSDDFQVVDFDIPDYLFDIEGDGNIIIDTEHLFGTTVLKEAELFEVTDSQQTETKLLGEKNWEGEDYGEIWEFEKPDWDYEPTDEGLAIINPTLKEEIWWPQTTVIGGLSLEQKHNYLVRLTLKVTSDGTYNVLLGYWSDPHCQYDVPVVGSDDWQVIDIEFPDFCGDAEIHSPIDDAYVFLRSGWVVGTTVLKKVEVYEVLGSSARGDKTAVKAVKTTNVDGAIYNLAGQKVDVSYKGIVIQNGKKRLAR